MPAGITTALESVLCKASQSTKFAEIWTPTAAGANESSAYIDDNIRFICDGTRRVFQLNAQTDEPSLKKFIKKNGTNTTLAVLDVAGQTGTKEEKEAFVEKAISEAAINITLVY